MRLASSQGKALPHGAWTRQVVTACDECVTGVTGVTGVTAGACALVGADVVGGARQQRVASIILDRKVDAGIRADGHEEGGRVDRVRPDAIILLHGSAEERLGRSAEGLGGGEDRELRAREREPAVAA